MTHIRHDATFACSLPSRGPPSFSPLLFADPFPRPKIIRHEISPYHVLLEEGGVEGERRVRCESELTEL